jgi:tetratricopeptide (TPR) repeat protein
VKIFGWALLLIAGLSLGAAAQNWLDAEPRQLPAEEETLYVSSAEALRRASLGFTGLFADVYWVRTTVYFGQNFERQKLTNEVFDVSRLRLLKPMLALVTELDPRHVTAYRFGGFFLQYENADEAIRFLELGIRNNPGEWRLYQDLGFAYWRQGKFKEAAESYSRGGQLPGAPDWMQPMAATMIAKGGDRETARQVFLRLYEESDDEFVRQVCAEQLRQLQTELPNPQ